MVGSGGRMFREGTKEVPTLGLKDKKSTRDREMKGKIC